jgi:diguanylate cyclase (GGDEF)-like protein
MGTFFIVMKIQQKINFLVFILATTFWLVHAYFDSLLSIEGVPFLESCFNPNTESLMLRGFVVLLLLIFSAFAEKVVKVFNNMARELKHQQDTLEDTVNQHMAINNEHTLTIKHLEKLADTDPLTSILNRRKFKELLQYEAERNQRYQFSLALILCDIDHFKMINDNFGHNEGDEVLKVFVKNITDNIRDVDVLARWGGEEFVILMPNSTTDNANNVAEKLRKMIELTDIKNVDHITASFGVTEFKASDTIESFIKRADDALYKAKEGGSNRVVAIA